MKNGHLADILLPHFTPSCSSTADFVRLYEIVVQAIPNNSQQLILNFMSRVRIVLLIYFFHIERSSVLLILDL